MTTMTKYFVTVIDPAKDPPAIAIMYCGHHWDKACSAVTRMAMTRFRGKNYILRVLTTRDGAVDSVQDLPII